MVNKENKNSAVKAVQAEEARKKQLELMKQVQDKLNHNLSKIFNSSEGIYVLKWLAINCHFLNSTCFNRKENDLEMSFNEGKRVMFLEIFSKLDNKIKNTLITDIFKKQGDK